MQNRHVSRHLPSKETANLDGDWDLLPANFCMTLFCGDGQSQKSWQETVHQTKKAETLISVKEKSAMIGDYL
jgi:hypothetical protein